MSKDDLISEISAATELSEEDSETVLKVFADVVKSELGDGGRVQIVRYGNDSVFGKGEMGENNEIR